MSVLCAPWRSSPGAAWATVSILLTLLFASPSAGAEPCQDARSWAARCSSEAVGVTLLRCQPGVLVVQTRVDGLRVLDVELTRANPKSFQQVADLGVSPVAEYADWSLAPPAVRKGFDTVVSCLQDHTGLELPAGTLRTAEERPTGNRGPAVSPRRLPVPWLFLGASSLLLAAAALHYRKQTLPPRRRRFRLTLVCALLTSMLALLLRAVVAGPSFVHQNGQGPLWVNFALCNPSAYGSGYSELFGAVSRHSGFEPHTAVFHTQSVLAAIAVGAAWLLLRGLGVRPWVSLALVVLLASEPTLARLARSESYFATISSLLLIASTAIVVSGRRRHPKDPTYLLCVAAAGLLIAQAARIHPLAWLPCALTPVSLIVARGRLRSRLEKALLATAIIGVLATLGAGPTLLSVGEGSVGSKWLPGLLRSVAGDRVIQGLTLGGLGAAAIVVFSARFRSGLVRALCYFAVTTVAFCSHVVAAGGPIIVVGYLTLFLPGWLATTGSGIEGALRNRKQGRTAAGLLLIVGWACGVWYAPAVLTPATDALEQAWLLEQRSLVPSHAQVAFLGNAGPRRTTVLPFYGRCGMDSPDTLRLSSTEPSPAQRPDHGVLTIWYRSSLCSTPEGQDYCATVERGSHLVPLATTELPARGSIQDLQYNRDPVSVGLYQVEGPLVRP